MQQLLEEWKRESQRQHLTMPQRQPNELAEHLEVREMIRIHARRVARLQPVCLAAFLRSRLQQVAHRVDELARCQPQILTPHAITHAILAFEAHVNPLGKITRTRSTQPIEQPRPPRRNRQRLCVVRALGSS